MNISFFLRTFPEHQPAWALGARAKSQEERRFNLRHAVCKTATPSNLRACAAAPGCACCGRCADHHRFIFHDQRTDEKDEEQMRPSALSSLHRSPQAATGLHRWAPCNKLYVN